MLQRGVLLCVLPRERKWFNGAVTFLPPASSSASISRARRFPQSGLGGNIPVEVAEELLHDHLLRRVFMHVADAAPGVNGGGDRGGRIVMNRRTEDGRRHDDPVIGNRGGVSLSMFALMNRLTL